MLWQHGLDCKPLVVDAACFDLLTFLDEDERGALRTAQDFESNLQSEFASILSRRLSFLQLGFFISIIFLARVGPGIKLHWFFQPGPRFSAGLPVFLT
jgi:hypothetical protein